MPSTGFIADAHGCVHLMHSRASSLRLQAVWRMPQNIEPSFVPGIFLSSQLQSKRK